MKNLTLVRHAKSSWIHDVDDRNRPLKKRGINDTKLVATAYRKIEEVINAVYSSPANRAFSTCKLFMQNLDIPLENVEIEENLYDFSGNQVIEFIKNLDQNDQSVMIFGHNNAFTSICNIFGNLYIDNLPTCGLVIIDFDVKSWKDINKGQTRLTIFPRDLK